MILNNATIAQHTLHQIGNKSIEGRFAPSKELTDLSDDLKEKLTPFYLNKFFTIPDRYKFSHVTSLQYNEVYNYVSAIFENPENFVEESKNIATHLYEKSIHPNIKAGEFHVVRFENIEYNDQIIDAIGLYKTEDKSGYLEVLEKSKSFGLNYKEGIDINKFDKGCLIFNYGKENGYELVVIDKQSKGEETKYWMDEFLTVVLISTEFTQTNEILSITKNYITKQLADEFEVSKTDKIDLLNRSIEYFKTHQSFDKNEFEEEVFHFPEMISSFRNFDQQYRTENEVEIGDQFDISPIAVKKQARVFKSVLKLDRNFHIYIHGDKTLIERGIEADGRKYYKIYFENEL